MTLSIQCKIQCFLLVGIEDNGKFGGAEHGCTGVSIMNGTAPLAFGECGTDNRVDVCCGYQPGNSLGSWQGFHQFLLIIITGVRRKNF
jgi:hypothetical protein